MYFCGEYLLSLCGFFLLLQCSWGGGCRVGIAEGIVANSRGVSIFSLLFRYFFLGFFFDQNPPLCELHKERDICICICCAHILAPKTCVLLRAKPGGDRGSALSRYSAIVTMWLRGVSGEGKEKRKRKETATFTPITERYLRVVLFHSLQSRVCCTIAFDALFVFSFVFHHKRKIRRQRQRCANESHKKKG